MLELGAWDPLLALALPLLWALYLAVLALWIILQKRSPLATLAWILALAALPLLGFVVYHFLGPHKIKRQRLRRQRLRRMNRCEACADPAAEATLTQRWRGLAQLVAKSTGAPVASASEVGLLVGGAATYAALLQAIAGARRQIHLEYYIIEPDAIGAQFRSALIERARAGVEVRLLIDALGSSRLSRRWLAPLREAGVEVARFHPFRLAALRPLLNFRTHRKIVVIDGELGFTGGINLADEHDARLSAGAWHDLHLQLRGQVVGWLQAVFAKDWLYASGRGLTERELYPTLTPGTIAAQVIASGPDSDSEAIHRSYLQALHQARERAWLATPYFVPGTAALYALGNAAMRGVDVRLLLPQRCDSRIVGLAGRSYYDELIARGVKIYEYQPSMLHAKALLVDDDLALLGTANFDLRSFELNFEVAVALYDRHFCTALEAQLAGDFDCARRVTQPRPISLLSRLAEASARLLSPVL